MGFGVWGLGLGFRGFRVWAGVRGLGFRVLGFTAWGLGFGVLGLRVYRGSGLDVRSPATNYTWNRVQDTCANAKNPKPKPSTLNPKP